MKLYHVLIGLVCPAIMACAQHRAASKAGSPVLDSLVYSYKTIKQRSPDCGAKADSDCTVASIKYPVFTDQPVLNDSISSKLISIFQFGEKMPPSLGQLAKQVITAYQADTNAINNHLSYSLDVSAKVARQDTSLLILQIEGYAFSGGAHGSFQTIFVNWDTKTGQQLTLNDLLNAGDSGALTGVGEKIFRKDEKLSDTASLAGEYFFDKGKFSLNNNFMIMPTGLRFLYNEYEIKSYAQGQTELFIPYAQIKSLLRPNTVVSHYIK